MSYSIIRMQKLKAPAIRGIQYHNQREKESETNPDIEKENSDLNYDLINAGKIDYVEAVKDRIEEGVESNKKIRKDAVRLCEFLITSDSEFFKSLSESDEKRFFETGLEFLKERYGEENILYATVHKDEKTPHMHVGFVPITEKKTLSAKDLFKKQDLVKLQDDFNKHVNEAGYKLERGVSSNREHLETAKFKAETLHQSVQYLDQKKFNLEQDVKAKEKQIVKTDAKLQESSQELEKRAKELRVQMAELERMREQIKRVEEPLKDLNSIPVKEKKLFGEVSMKKADFEKVMSLAKQSLDSDKEKVDLQKENQDLRSERDRYKASYEHKESMFDSYFKENQQLKRENKKLIQERNKFEKLYDFAKKLMLNMFKDVKRLEQVKGIFAAKEKELEREPKQKEMELDR